MPIALRTLLGLAVFLSAAPARAQDDPLPEGELEAAYDDPVLRELAGLRREVAELRALLESMQDALAVCQAAASMPRYAVTTAIPGAGGAAPAAEEAASRAEYRTMTSAPGQAAAEALPAPPDAPADAPAGAPDAETAPPDAEAAPPQPVAYTIVREWGRTPAQAESLGADTQTLKGMVLAVPAGTPPAAVDQLGRDLRTQFGAYDNINIEIFDEIDAAGQFAKTNSSNPAHRVLSVSKHRASGRDVILAFRDGITLEVAQ